MMHGPIYIRSSSTKHTAGETVAPEQELAQLGRSKTLR